VKSAAHSSPGRGDVYASTGVMALLGCGTVLFVLGAMSGTWQLLLIGGAAAGGALMLLAAAHWIDGLLLLPLVLTLPAFAGTGPVRVTPAIVLTAIVLVAWLCGHAGIRRRIDTGPLPLRGILAFFTAVVISAAFAEHRVAAVRELVNIGLLLGLLIVATAHLNEQRSRIGTLASILAVVTGTAGFLAVLEMTGFGGRFPLAGTGLNRAALGFGWPNELGMYFSVAIPLCVHACVAARGHDARLFAIVALVVSLGGLMATFSRGSWLSLFAASAVLLLAREHRFVIRIWIIALLVFAVTDILSGGAVIGRLANTIQDPLVAQRAALMITALLVFQAHPLIGIGPGGFAESLDVYGPQVDWLWNYVGTAHNAYIDIAAELGVVGLIAYLGVIAAIFMILLRSARRYRSTPDMTLRERSLRRAILWSFATMIVVSFTAWPFAHGVGQLIMLIAAMGIAIESEPAAP
jgi:putative inorganic carbon (hco3(-)) transporter